MRVHTLRKWLRIAGLMDEEAPTIDHKNCHYRRHWLFSTEPPGCVGCIECPRPPNNQGFDFSSLEGLDKQCESSSNLVPGPSALFYLENIQVRHKGVV